MLVPAILTATGVPLLLLSEWRGWVGLRLVSKTAAAGGFVWGGAIAVGAGGAPYQWWMLAGFCLSLVGDMCLLSRARRAFIFGLGAFLIAHLCYATAFLAVGGEHWVQAAALVGAGAVSMVAWRWLGAHIPDGMRHAVLAYFVAISLMLASAIAAGLGPGSRWVSLGAVCFAISDLSVARDRFISRSVKNLAWGAPLYFGAQWMFITGLGSN